ncbi:MAG: hypothetical protein ACP5FH_12425 [Terracidiphilus sp.]
MDLRTISNAVSNTVNPNVPVTVQFSTGYTVGAGLKQVPSYSSPVSGFAQLQALSEEDLKHLDGMNIQGATWSIILKGALNASLRTTAQGGDLVTFNGQTFLTVAVLEQWPLWTRAAIRLQDANN